MAGYLGSVPVPQATQHRESFTCTEGQTSFATAGYTPQFLDLYLNGSHLSPADFTATNGSDVVLGVAASADDVCDIISYTPFEVADQTFTGTTTLDGAVVINESSADVDFRVESDNLTHALFVQGSDGNVGIGNSAPAANLGITQSGDNVGLLVSGGGYNYTAKFESSDAEANIIIEDSNSTNDGNMIGVVTNDMYFVTNTAERMRINALGNVGLGISTVNNTYSSSHALQIASVSDNNWGGTLILSSANGSSVFSRLVNSTDGLDIINQIATPMRFFTANTERMRLNAGGGLNIATGGLADVSASNLEGVSLMKFSGQGLIRIANNATSGKNCIEFFNGNGQVGTIATSSSATAYNTSSDYRLKENVVYDWDATTRLKQLKPARFNFIADANKTVDGFLAHEAQAVVPESVTGTKDEVEVWKNGEELPDGVSVGDNKLDTDGNTMPDMQGIDQSKLVPLLVKTIQELEARITALEG